jgi:hypothetical protein
MPCRSAWEQPSDPRAGLLRPGELPLVPLPPTAPPKTHPPLQTRPPPQESTVVQLLMQGLQALCKERPENPVEYLANYLLQHNPQKPGAAAAAAPAAARDGGAPPA